MKSSVYILRKRQELRMTQKQFAAFLKVDIRTVQNWEYGNNEPRAKHILKLEGY